jgi:signal transduction histidine kinase
MQPSMETLQEELALRNRQLAAIHKISAALLTKTHTDALLEETLQESLQAVQAEAGSILLYDAERGKLVFRHVIGPARDSLLGQERDPSLGICGHVFTTGQPSIVGDVRQSEDHDSGVDVHTGYVTRNMVTIPLLASPENPIGVMQILNKHQGFDEHDIEVLMAMSSHAAAVILREEAKLAEVVKLLGDISHDIKNMITPVSTCAQTLDLILKRLFQDLDAILTDPSLERPALTAAIREKLTFFREFYPQAIQMLLGGSRAVQDRVREIADCVKGIEATPSFELLDINEIIGQVVTPLRFMAEAHQLSLDTRGLGPVPLVPLDRKRIFNAIYNLIHNAIPETPPGGTIWVHTAAQQGGGPFPEGHYLLIEVADNGKGMPPQVRERLFTRNAISTKPGGTGLGTRIVKNAVDVHNGHIAVCSEEGKGTRFQIKIPLERIEEE